MAQEKLGKPSSKTATSANWSKGEWSWHLNFDKGSSVQACVHFVPEKTTYTSITELIGLFGFSKEKGWSVGPRQRTAPMLDSFFITHKDRGIVLLKATHGEKDGTWSVLNFFAPGYSEPPRK